MFNCFIVGLGGFFGAALRYLFSLLPLDRSGIFPLHTLLINIIGSFLIGLLAAAAAKNLCSDPRLMLFLKTGICGGFTTFSTFALESSALIQSGRPGLAVAYIALSVLLSIGAVFLAEALLRG